MRKTAVNLVLLCFCLCSQLFGKSHPDPLIETSRAAQRGVAAVTVRAVRINLGPGAFLPRSVGTAFFISDEYLLTAAHVVHDAANESLYVPMFAGDDVNRINGGFPLKFEVVESDDRFDVALLHILEKPPTRRTGESSHIIPFQIAVGSLPPGEPVAVTGYGAYADFPLTMTGFTASQGSMQFDSALRLLQRAGPSFGDRSSVFVIDRPLAGGFSGSPVYLQDSGVVYGIAVEVRPDPNSGAPAMSLAHPLAKARELLDKHGIAYKSVRPLNPLVSP